MPQKHSAIRHGKRLVWYTDGLWSRSKDLKPFDLRIDAIAELDRNCWFGTNAPTLREVAEHMKRIESADLGFPIILNDNGTLMDGGHRICKAFIRGDATIRAVQFEEMPEADATYDIDARHGTRQVPEGDDRPVRERDVSLTPEP